VEQIIEGNKMIIYVFKRIGKWIWNIVQACDRLLNAILFGTDKEYLSSRIYRFREKHWFVMFCYNVLNTIDNNHCEKAYADAQIGFDPYDAVIR
jgi:hypothetical protein